MSPLTIIWSMLASASVMLGLFHLLFWIKNRTATVYLLSSLMAFSAGVSAILELAMMFTQNLDSYRILVRWGNVSIFMILIPMVWFVYIYFNTARRWLAITITLLWSAGLVVNFISPHSLTFIDITEVRQHVTFWGEYFFIPVGRESPWKYLADITSLLILIYVVDASYHLWQQGMKQRTVIIGGGIVVFILAAGIHTPLVDAGLVKTPYMVTFSFLAIVISMSYQLASDAIQARFYEKELQHTRQNLDRLVRANMLGEYTTMLAHELNQPLTAILSNAQAARRYLDSGISQVKIIDEILEDIVRDDKRASDIIHRLRRMLRKDPVVHEPFDLNAAIMEVIKILSREMKVKGIRLVTNFSRNLPLIRAGQIEIQQVVLNLLTNAIKALESETIADQRITLTTTKLENEVSVYVADSGLGIPEQIRETIFDSYIGDNNDGLGLGLAISRRIIETYGGHISAEDRESGGSVFSFSLPIE